MARETLIISDLHQCYDELRDLLDKAKYDPAEHRLISVGDITSRGPNLRGCIDLLRSVNAEVVAANHEDKLLRYHRAKIKELKALPYLSAYKQTIYDQLTESDLAWFASFPVSICVRDDTFVIHGGLEANKSWFLQDPYQMQRVRYLNKDGSAFKGKYQAKGTDFWPTRWTGKQSIIFGHSTVDKPTVFKNEQNTIWAIDTACVFGGHLTGYFYERNEFIQVKARKVYWQRKS